VRIVHAVSIGPTDSLGVYVAVRELAIAQAELGADVTISVIGGWPQDDIRERGVKIRNGNLREAVRAIGAVGGAPMIVHTHVVWTPSTLLPLSFRRDPRRVFVESPHGCLAADVLSKSRLKKRAAWALLFKPALLRYRQIQVSADKEADEVTASGLKVPVRVIPNAVSAPPFPIAATRRPDKVGFVGRLHPVKGVRELIEAWGAVRDAFPGWTLDLVGPATDPAYAAELRHLAERAGGVTFHGPLYGEERWRFLADCAVVAVPSKTENFCYVVAEAYLAGAPVLTTNGVPWPEINRQGFGWRGDGDPASLATMLRAAMATPPEQRAAMAEAGRNWVAGQYGRPAIGAASMRAYEEVLA
jgi:glycosyltransferase involved in cell wall biosynthesis